MPPGTTPAILRSAQRQGRLDRGPCTGDRITRVAGWLRSGRCSRIDPLRARAAGPSRRGDAASRSFPPNRPERPSGRNPRPQSGRSLRRARTSGSPRKHYVRSACFSLLRRCTLSRVSYLFVPPACRSETLALLGLHTAGARQNDIKNRMMGQWVTDSGYGVLPSRQSGARRGGDTTTGPIP